MLSQLRPAVVMIALFTLLTGAILPPLFVQIGALVFPFQAGGSLVQKDGKIVGSAIIGQNFTAPKYFWGRPSALMGTDPKDSSKQIATPYDASESGASNLAPTSKALIDRVKGDVPKYGTVPVPADAVTSSASGLDPDISPENAARQVARVAAARGVTSDKVAALVASHTQGLTLGLLGAPRVNVLELNMALDDALPAAAPAAAAPAPSAVAKAP
jgi:potassium-transporting ATPase KdpC subunit